MQLSLIFWKEKTNVLYFFFKDYQSNPWLIHLVGKLLVNDGNATELMEKNPFEDDEPPM